ncbi:hypothetical protein LUU34_00797600 [Aix galericulata]|nr:hypothetical protein LUU34_00797600 [Aix galericulata]
MNKCACLNKSPKKKKKEIPPPKPPLVSASGRGAQQILCAAFSGLKLRSSLGPREAFRYAASVEKPPGTLRLQNRVPFYGVQQHIQHFVQLNQELKETDEACLSHAERPSLKTAPLEMAVRKMPALAVRAARWEPCFLHPVLTTTSSAARSRSLLLVTTMPIHS